MNNYSSHFSSEDFLEDVKSEIKHQYGRQSLFADEIHCHRNTVGNVLNHPERLTLYWINLFARELGMDLRYYIFD